MYQKLLLLLVLTHQMSKCLAFINNNNFFRTKVSHPSTFLYSTSTTSSISIPTSESSKVRIQSMDATSVRIIVEELSTTLVPSRIENVVEDGPNSIALQLKNRQGKLLWLLLSWDQDAARIGLEKSPLRLDNGNSNSFVALLRNTLKGSFINKLELPLPFERIINIQISKSVSNIENGDASGIMKLILEIMGSKSNLMLVSGKDSTIQACAFQVGLARNRPIQVMSPYTLPDLHAPRNAFTNSVLALSKSTTISGKSLSSSPSSSVKLNYDHFHNILYDCKKKTIRKVLLKELIGTSPAIIDSLLHSCETNGTVMVEDILQDDKKMQQLFTYLVSWYQFMINVDISGDKIGDCHHILCYPHTLSLPSSSSYWTMKFDNKYSSSLISSFDATQLKVSSFLGDYYKHAQRKKIYSSTYDKCRRNLQAQVLKTSTVIESLEGKLAKASGGGAESLRVKADLVTAYIHSWDGYTNSLNCYDFETGEALVIDLPTQTTPSDYANILYKKARKMERSIDTLKLLIPRAQIMHQALLTLESSLDSMGVLQSDTDIFTLYDLLDDLNELNLQSVLNVEDLDLNASDKNDINNMFDEDDEPMIPKKKKEKSSHKNKKNKKAKEQKMLKLKLKEKEKGNKSNQSGSKANISNRNGKGKASKLQGLLVIQLSSPDMNNNVINDDNNNNDNSNEEDEYNDPSSPPSHSTLSLIVGRSSRQNERITFEIATNNDIWFHVQGIPGSHCLLQLQPGQDANDENIQYAADVASYYSKAKDTSSVPVGYCSPKYIKRAPGKVLGSVIVSKQDGMVYGRPDKGKQIIERNREKEYSN